MYYQYGQNCIFGAKFYPEIYKRGILFIGSPGIKAWEVHTDRQPDKVTLSLLELLAAVKS